MEDTETFQTTMNNLPEEIITKIADKLPVEERLHFQKAYANFPERKAGIIQKGLTRSLSTVSCLYLKLVNTTVDNLELQNHHLNYNDKLELWKYHLNYEDNLELWNYHFNYDDDEDDDAVKYFPPQNAEEQKEEEAKFEQFTINSPDLLNKPDNLQATFTGVQELKVLFTKGKISLMVSLVKSLSKHLTTLKLLLFVRNRFSSRKWSYKELRNVILELNPLPFPHLTHLTMVFTAQRAEALQHGRAMLPITAAEQMHRFLEQSFTLLSSPNLQECYLRLPAPMLWHQLSLLEKNPSLKKVGLYVHPAVMENSFYRNEYEYLLRTITKPLAEKIVYLENLHNCKNHETYYYSKLFQKHLNKFTSLRTVVVNLSSKNRCVKKYVKLMETLKEFKYLQNLHICLSYQPVSMATFRSLSNFDPLRSVTTLKLEVDRIDTDVKGDHTKVLFSHQIFSEQQLRVAQLFPNLRQIELKFPQNYSCSLCERIPFGVDSIEREECVQQTVAPLRVGPVQLKFGF